ncbi:MAG: phosphatidate cytidylyltransferase [Butyricicoccus sp.]
MKARVLFGVGGFAFVLLALYVFPPVVLAIALTALCVLASYELTAATGLVKNRRVIEHCTGFPLVLGCIMYFNPKATLLLIAWAALILMIALFGVLLRHHDTVTFPEITVALFGGLVLPLLLLSLWRIFSMDGGEFLVLLPLVAAWGSDTCALFAGMAFGKHKLAPVISPKKTVEGAIGGVIGATVLMLLVVYLFNRFAGLDIHYSAAAIMGACGAVIGQIGDLSFSIIKRQTGIKDYGHIFPGHGGVLDRFDSVIFVAPVAELILRLFGV